MNAPTPPLHLLPEVNQRPVPAELIEALQAQFGTRCSTALVVREQHGRDESSFDVPPPELVVPQYLPSEPRISAACGLEPGAAPVVPVKLSSVVTAPD